MNHWLVYIFIKNRDFESKKEPKKFHRPDLKTKPANNLPLRVLGWAWVAPGAAEGGLPHAAGDLQEEPPAGHPRGHRPVGAGKPLADCIVNW